MAQTAVSAGGMPYLLLGVCHQPLTQMHEDLTTKCSLAMLDLPEADTLHSLVGRQISTLPGNVHFLHKQ